LLPKLIYRSLFSEAYLVKLILRGLVTVANIFSSINPAIGALRSTIVVVLTIRVLNS